MAVGAHTVSTYAILEAPSTLGLKQTGVERLPEALLSAGLADRLRAKHRGTVTPPRYNPQRHADHGLLNVDGIARYTKDLADAVERILNDGEFPIVLGGDCSIVLGNLLALRRRGRHGLLFADGHADFYQPEANINGEAASSDLAFATGRGPPAITRFEGWNQLVLDEDVAMFGFRDEAEQREYGSQTLPDTMLALDLATVRHLGIEEAAREALDRVCRAELAGFWIHLDADVLDDAIMPAVDYRIPGGLTWDELATLLRLARQSGRAVGMEITIYNPTLDPSRTIAREFTATIVRGLME